VTWHWQCFGRTPDGHITFSRVFPEDTPKWEVRRWGQEEERKDLYEVPALQRKKVIGVTISSLVIDYWRYYSDPDNLWKRKKSYDNEHKAIEAFLDRRPDLCQKPVQSLTTKDIQEYCDAQINAGIEGSTLRRNLINPFRAIINKFAKKQLGFPLKDPFRDVELPENPPPRKRVLKPSERPRLYNAIEECRGDQRKHLWFALVVAALYTALRRGQLFKLQWKDIDFEQMLIWAYPAKKNPERWLPLAQELGWYLEDYRQTIPEEDRTPHSKVFPITNNAHEQAWKRIVKRANLFETREDGSVDYLHFHDLRHTAATAFRIAGLSMEENDYMLGDNLKNTKRKTSIYEHQPVIEDIRNKLNASSKAFPLPTLENDVIMRRLQRERGNKQGLWQWEEGLITTKELEDSKS
jgi:integrase